MDTLKNWQDLQRLIAAYRDNQYSDTGLNVRLDAKSDGSCRLRVTSPEGPLMLHEAIAVGEILHAYQDADERLAMLMVVGTMANNGLELHQA